MLVDTSAIVLKTIAFSESSLIVTLLSDKHGKIAVMARGARRNKNRFGGMLQPGAVLDVTYYYKTTREVQNLSDIALKKSTWRIHQEIEKMAIGLTTLELCDQLCHEHEPMPEIFGFLSGFLPWLHETGTNPKNLFPYIQFRLTQLTGIGISWDPDITKSVNDNQDNNGPPCYLNVESGQIARAPDEGLHFPITKLQQYYLRCIISGKKSQLLSESFPPLEIKNLIHHFDVYFQYHMEGVKARKADAIFDQILC